MKNNSTFTQIIDYKNPTVIDKYEHLKNNISSEFETEQMLENKFINQLKNQGYEYLKLDDINNCENILIENLKKQIEKLNNFKFSDDEWNRLFKNYIANREKNDIQEKTNIIQNDYIYELNLDNNKTKNIKLIDKDNIFNNHLQVINQYANNDGSYKNRYDVTILINGLPLIHIELKRRGINIKEAFNQIERYKSDSFWSSNGLFNYVQIFVISNGTSTKYYSNTTREIQIQNKKYKSNISKSFEFTSYWTDSENEKIEDLIEFTETFFSKHTILNIITKYCIFTSNKELIVMRPYQIVATEKIVNKVIIGFNNKKFGTIDAGGYVWHTTGSGKTITSFKTSQLLTKLNFIDKILFIVDRKDLDFQTMNEYDKFQKGAANSNSNIKILEKQLSSDSNKDRIIITTIQKLSHFIKKNPQHNSYKKNIVMIFDECHRSQFGKMHNDIINKFKNYAIFGFTGTPIFAKNASVVSTKEIINQLDKSNMSLKTTEQLFGERIHTYTILDAILDHNVLKFKYTYVNTIKSISENLIDEKVKGIYTESAFESKQHIKMVTDYIIKNFNTYTYHEQDYSHNIVSNTIDVAKDKKNIVDHDFEKKNIKGFNSIFAVSSVECAKLYYEEFKKQQQEKHTNLKVATIFSYSPNEEKKDYDEEILIDDENNESVGNLDESSRKFLEQAIQDYNKMFGTNWDTSNEKFQSYYKDISLKMKNKEIDILIVVNMFLTGFDSPTLNTLWIDKKLKMHGLIQAFSRTNRILNSIKQCGQIVSFRNLKQRIDEAISLFGNNKSLGLIILENFDYYYDGSSNNENKNENYLFYCNELKQKYNPKTTIIREEDKIKFIKLFSKFLQIRNILMSFPEFDKDKEKMSKFELQEYLSRYHEYYSEIEKTFKNSNYKIDQDLVYELDLVKQLDINIDYLLNKIDEYHSKNIKHKDIQNMINIIINSSYSLKSKKELIIDFLNSIKDNTVEESNVHIRDEFVEFYRNRQEIDLLNIVNEYNLDLEKTKNFINRCKDNDEFIDYGDNIKNLTLNKLPRFSNIDGKNSREIIQNIKNKLKKYCENYFSI